MDQVNLSLLLPSISILPSIPQTQALPFHGTISHLGPSYLSVLVWTTSLQATACWPIPLRIPPLHASTSSISRTFLNVDYHHACHTDVVPGNDPSSLAISARKIAGMLPSTSSAGAIQPSCSLPSKYRLKCQHISSPVVDIWKLCWECAER